MRAKGKDFVQIPHVWLDMASQKMGPEEQLLFIHLARFCYDDKDTAYPSQATLARLTGLAERTVRKYIGIMLEKGIVTIVDRHTKGKPKLNTYRLIDWYGIERIENTPIGKRCRMKGDKANGAYPIGKPCLSNRQTVPFDEAQFADEEYEGRIGIEEYESSSDDECGLRPEETGKPDTLEEKENRDNIVPPPVWQFDDRNKPLDLDDCSGLTLEQVQHKIYFYFRKEYPTTAVQKHKAMLYRITNLDLLRQAASCLPYWKDMQYGDGSLCMFVTNLEQFLGNAEARRFRLKAAWEEDNREILVDKTIKENNIFDIRDRANRNILPQTVKARPIQLNWLQVSPDEIYFRGGNLALGSLWGEIIRPDEFHYISDPRIRRILREYNGVAV